MAKGGPGHRLEVLRSERLTPHIQRVVLNEKGLPVQREPLLTELKQRIRDVRPGPDGLLYVLTEEDSGALLKIEPAP